jgi:hypothetical protein
MAFQNGFAVVGSLTIPGSALGIVAEKERNGITIWPNSLGIQILRAVSVFPEEGRGAA